MAVTTEHAFVSAPIMEIGGRVEVPGDKSISHRAVMLGAVAEGSTEIEGFLAGEDCLATLAALEAMGARVDRRAETELTIEGCGLRGLRAPAGPLDMGNSGTAMRLMAGLLAAQSFGSTLIGDASLTRRPMERIAAPLRLMGAQIESADGFPPLVIGGNRSLRGIDYTLPVASAQVKSAILLAGLYAAGQTSVTEPAVTRDHTERMLEQFGAPLTRNGRRIVLRRTERLNAASVFVPGDMSSAAFFLLAGCLARRGELVVDRVGLNPTRTGILRIFEMMQADIEIQEHRDGGAEPWGSVIARPGHLRGARIPAEFVPLAIDEFPLVFVAAALAEGETIISNAGELRHKESDRIGVMVEGLRTLGADIEERPDGAVIRGGRLSGGTVHSHGDHRVAMAFAIAGAAAEAPVTVRDVANVATSFPGFVARARSIGLDIRAVDADRQA